MYGNPEFLLKGTALCLLVNRFLMRIMWFCTITYVCSRCFCSGPVRRPCTSRLCRLSGRGWVALAQPDMSARKTLISKSQANATERQCVYRCSNYTDYYLIVLINPGCLIGTEQRPSRCKNQSAKIWRATVNYLWVKMNFWSYNFWCVGRMLPPHAG